MLGVNQLDFINYANALKGNYRKGVHKMEAIMASPTHAKEFASNLGGVSVVLSVPIGKEDRNSAQPARPAAEQRCRRRRGLYLARAVL